MESYPGKGSIVHCTVISPLNLGGFYSTCNFSGVSVFPLKDLQVSAARRTLMIVHRYPVTQATALMESTHSRVTVQGLGMKALHVRMTLMSVTSHLPVKITVLVTTAMAPTSVDVFRDLKERIVKSTLMNTSQVHANMEVIIFSAFSFFPSGLFSLSLWSTSSR